MRKLLFLLILVGAGYLAYQKNAASKSVKLAAPSVAAWKHFPPAPNQYVERVAIFENRWRVEITGSAKPLVAVFDGTSFASTHPKTTAAQLDPVKILQGVYAALPSPVTAPVEQIEESDCWHFREDKDGSVNGVWVDTKTHFVRKVSRQTGGKISVDDYELLPVDVEGLAGRLFDRKNLQILLPE